MTRFLSATVLALSFATAMPALAQDAPPIPKIMVVGEGEASVAPDLAILSLSVMKEAPTAREAMSANNEAMSAVIAELKAFGIADRDLQTAGIQINPRYEYSNRADGSQEARLVAYQVSNTLTVRVRDLPKAGEVLDKAVSMGVNQGGNIAFGNDDSSATVTEARTEAVKSAVEKARTLAQAAGVELGRILEISELSYAPQPMPIEAKAFDAAAPAVPIQPGENSYRVQVNVTFELR